MGNETSAAQTRSRLLTAAAEEILQQGYAAASMARIAERIGLTKGAFSHHFPTKDTLIEAAMQHVVRLAPSLVESATALFPESPIRICVGIMGCIAAASVMDPVVGASLLMFQDPSVSVVNLVPVQQAMVGMFEPCFRGAVDREGYHLTMPTDDAAQFVVLVLIGSLSARRFPGMFDLRRERIFVQAALAGLGIHDAEAVVGDVLDTLSTR